MAQKVLNIIGNTARAWNDYTEVIWPCRQPRLQRTHRLGNGLHIFSDAKTPVAYHLGQNHPPFNPTTTITIHLKKSSTVELKIYDTLGKRIRTLVQAKRPAGSHEVVWDGRDDAGNPVPSGQYFVELQAGNAVSSRKLLLAK